MINLIVKVLKLLIVAKTLLKHNIRITIKSEALELKVEKFPHRVIASVVVGLCKILFFAIVPRNFKPSSSKK